jgi:hypothetical protein
MRVYGVSGSLTVERADDLGAATSALSTDKLLLVQRSGSIELYDRGFSCCNVSFSSGGSPLLAGFSSDGSQAIIRDATRSVLHHYANQQLSEIPFPYPGEIIALAVTSPNQFSAVVTSKGAVTILTLRLPDGALQNEAKLSAGVSAAVLFPSGSALLLRDSRVIHRTASGEEQQIELSADITALTWLGPNWAQANTSTGAEFAIRIEPKLRVLELPEVQP